MQHKILAQLELDPRSMRQATNQGLPLIMAQPNHPLAEAFAGLAQQELALLEPKAAEVVEEAEEPVQEERTRRSGLFGRLRR